jgi:hypothetical protein
MKTLSRILLGLIVCMVPVVANAQRERVKIPMALEAFVAADTKPIEYKSADLNGDGKMDHILVLANTRVAADEEHNDESKRPLLIIITGADGKLTEAARNELVVGCAGCGGMMGDPFEGVTAGKGTFTITNSGGSRDRWSYEYTFNYSRKDNAWQLVRVVETTSDTLKPKNGTNKVMTPPKSFGKIDFVDFDPDEFKGKGEK